VLYFINKKLQINPENTELLYKSVVSCHLEYCIQVPRSVSEDIL